MSKGEPENISVNTQNAFEVAPAPPQMSTQDTNKPLTSPEVSEHKTVNAFQKFENLDLNELFFSLENGFLPDDGLYTAFEEAFFEYFILNSTDFFNALNFNNSIETPFTEPNFLNLSFEELFNVLLTEGGSENTQVALSEQDAFIISVSTDTSTRVENVGQNIITSVTSIARQVSTTVSDAPVPPPSVLIPVVIPGAIPPTTPQQTVFDVEVKTLNFSVFANYAGNIFEFGPYNGLAASFGPDGGSLVNASFSFPILPGSTQDLSNPGIVILTSPSGNYLTFYTASVNGHDVGDYIYTLVEPFSIYTTPPEDIVMIGGQRYFLEHFRYSLTTDKMYVGVAEILIIIKDDAPVATSITNPTPISESDISPTGTNLQSTSPQITGSIITSPTSDPPNYFGQNGGSVTNVTIAGGSTVIVGNTITVTDSLGNTLVLDALTGNYVYTLNHPFQNTNNLPTYEVFDTYVFTDNNGNTATASLTIIINDDIPVAINLVATGITESNIPVVGSNLLSGLNTISGIIVPTLSTLSTPRYGADGAALTGGVTNASLISIDGATTVTGISIFTTITQAQIDNSNNALSSANLNHAAILITDSLGNTLLIDQVTSQYVYTLVQAFHNTIPNVAAVLTYSYELTDSDGSIATATITVTVQDDKPIAVNISAPIINESNIPVVGSNLLSSLDTISGILVPNAPATNTSRYGADGAATAGGVTNASLVSISGATTVTGITTFTTITATDVTNSNGALSASNVGHAAILITDSLGNTLLIDQLTSQYVYTLHQAFHNTTPDVSAIITYSYQLTDSDGSTATANIIVTITDDKPVAVNIVAGLMDEANIQGEGSHLLSSYNTISGILVPTSVTLSTSRYGADGAALSGGVSNAALVSISGATSVSATTTFSTITQAQIDNSNGAFTSTNLGHAAILVTDALGNVLVIDRLTSEFVYTLNQAFHQNTPNTTATITFSYQLIDSDGSTATANITVTVQDDKPIAVNITAGSMDEADIRLVGSDLLSTYNTIFGILVPSSPTLSTSQYGADGPAAAGGVTNASLVSVSGATSVTATTTFSTITATQIANSNGALTSANLGHNAILVTDSLGNVLLIDRVTNQYVYTLHQAFHQDTPNTSATITYSYVLTDSDGSTATANIVVTVNDDHPIAVNITTATINESNIPVVGSNVLNSFDTISGVLVPTMPTTSTSRYGADGAATAGGVTNATLVSVSGATAVTGTTIFTSITQTDIDNSNGAFTSANLGHNAISVTDSLGNVLLIDRVTNQYLYTLNTAFHQTTPDTNATITYSYQLTDSDGSTATANIIVTVQDDHPIAVNITAPIINEANIPVVGSNLLSGYDTISGILVPTMPTTSTSRYGADGAATAGGVTNAALVSVSGATAVTGTTVFTSITQTDIDNSNGAFTSANLGHNAISVTDSLGNVLLIDRVTNQYLYTLNTAFHQTTPDTNATITYSYQLTDSDGSTATANIIVTVQDDHPIAVNITAPLIDEANIRLDGSNLLSSYDTISGILVPTMPTTSTSRYGADGAAPAGGVSNASLTGVSGATTVTGTTTFTLITLSDIANSNGAFDASNLNHAAILVTDSLGNTLLIDQMTSQYVYTLNQAFHHDTPNTTATVTFSYELTDSDGSTANANIIVTVKDDHPITVNQSNTADETILYVDGSETATGNILVGDVFGADGPGGITNINGSSTIVSGVITVSTTYGSISVYTTAQGIYQVGDYVYTLDSAKTKLAADSLLHVTDQISYQITDSDGSTSTSYLNIDIDLNQTPTTMDDVGLTNENTILSVSAANGVLFNDTDPDAGDTKAVFSVNGNASSVNNVIILLDGSQFQLNSDGSYTFNPNTSATLQGLNYGQSVVETINYVMQDAEGLMSTGQLKITVTGVNDAPAGTDGAVTTNEDTAYVFLTSDFGFTDPIDIPGNNFLAVEISTLPDAGILTLNNIAVTAGQFILASDIASGLLIFTSDPNANGMSYSSFTFQVQDDGGTADGGINLDQSPNILTINVTSVNDAPAGTDNTVTTNEDTAYVFTVADFGFSDPNDTPANVLLNVVITTLPSSGILLLNNVAVMMGDSISAADIIAGNLVFNPAMNANGLGNSSFTFQVQDDGGVNNGGVNLDQTANTITIDVNSINDAPTGADKTVSVNEDGAYTFSTTDFGFSDASDSPANALSAVEITSLPTNGSLTLNGNAVTASQFISASDITAGFLVFSPAPNANGAGYASFTFQVQDDGGTANNGVDLDQTANTITINVNPINDPPNANDDTNVGPIYDRDVSSNILNILANDTDIDTGDTKTVTTASINSITGYGFSSAVLPLTPIPLIWTAVAISGNEVAKFMITAQGEFAQLYTSTNVPAYLTIMQDGTVSLDSGDAFDYLPVNETLNISLNYTMQDGSAASDSAGISLTITGLDNNDVVLGTNGNDTLSGGAGNDALYSGDGDDVLIGGPGADLLDGGNNNDTIDYANSSQGVNVNLLTGVNTGGDAAGDTLVFSSALSGIKYALYGNQNGSVQTLVNTMTAGTLPVREGVIPGPDLNYIFNNAAFYNAAQASSPIVTNYSTNYGIYMIGNMNITTGGSYQFILNSDNESLIKIDGQPILTDTHLTSNGLPSVVAIASTVTVNLSAGIHVIEILFGENTGGDYLRIAYNGPDTGNVDSLLNPSLSYQVANVENIVGSDFADKLTGNALTNNITGGLGNDVINGVGGADHIKGGAGADKITYYNVAGSVLDGDDVTNDSTNDTLVINAQIANVNLSLADQTAGDNTNVLNFENVDASGAISAVNILGSTGANTILGGSNNDTLDGLSGVDIIRGNAGDDTVTYYNVAGAVLDGDNVTNNSVNDTLVMVGTNVATVNLSLADQTVGDNTNVLNFENVNASAATVAVSLTGSSGINTLLGGSGSDVIDGKDGADIVRGGAGADAITYYNVVGSTLDGDNVTNNNLNDTLVITGSTVVTVNLSLADQTVGDNTKVLNFENVDASTATSALMITGSAGANTILGGSGDDLLTGGAGADNLNGGAGSDTASYVTSNQAVNVNLATGTGTGGDAQGDTLNAIENLVGSAFSDTFIGDGNNNILEGGASADILEGGGGTDTASYSTSNQAVNVNLTTGQATGGDAQGDTLNSIENLIGSAFNDTLTGNENDNTLEGGAGADILDGGAGNDTASYAHSSQGVNVNLATGVLSGGDAQGDVLVQKTIQGLNYAYYTNLGGGSTQDVLNAIAAGVSPTRVGVSPGIDMAYIVPGFVPYNVPQVDIRVAASTDFGINYGIIMTGVLNITTGGTYYFKLNSDDGSQIKIDGTLIIKEDILTSNIDGALYGIHEISPLDTGVYALNLSAGMHSIEVLFKEGSGTDFVRTAYAGPDTNGAYSLLNSALSSVTNTIENLTGSQYGDTLIGDANNNILEGLGGADILVGGAGTDTATYAHSAQGVTVNLATGTGTGGDAQGDTLSQIENITGSNFNDSLTGDANNNVLEGGAGADILDGGAGSDTASYAHSSQGVNVNLSTLQASGGDAQGDTIVSAGNGMYYEYFTNVSGNNASDIMNYIATGAIATQTGVIPNIDLAYIFNTTPYTATQAVNQISGVDISSNYGVHMLGNLNITTAGTYQFVLNSDDESQVIIDGVNVMSDSYVYSITNGITVNDNAGLKGTFSFNLTAGIHTIEVYYKEGGGGDYIRIAYSGPDTGNNFSLLNANLSSGVSSIENLIGSDYNDTLIGNVASNILNGGLGNDILDGQGGQDTVSYAGTASLYGIAGVTGVIVNLNTTLQQDTVNAGLDTISNIENIIGSDFNDIFIANNATTQLNNYNGGLGVDTLSYALASAAVTINLNTITTQNTIGAGSDIINNIENLIGSQFNDTLTGAANVANIIAGNGGDDTIDGGTGSGVDMLDFSNAPGVGPTGVTLTLYNNNNDNVFTTLTIANMPTALGLGVDSYRNIEGVIGTQFDDTLTGSGSNDVIDPNLSVTKDIIDGAGGVDTISFASLSNVGTGITLTLDGVNFATATGTGVDADVKNFENILGSSRADILSGDANNNVIDGGVGNVVDTLSGGGGVDTPE